MPCFLDTRQQRLGHHYHAGAPAVRAVIHRAVAVCRLVAGVEHLNGQPAATHRPAEHAKRGNALDQFGKQADDGYPHGAANLLSGGASIAVSILGEPLRHVRKEGPIHKRIRRPYSIKIRPIDAQQFLLGNHLGDELPHEGNQTFPLASDHENIVRAGFH